jgi:uncharacterized coiled-coil DUF342 family protein
MKYINREDFTGLKERVNKWVRREEFEDLEEDLQTISNRVEKEWVTKVGMEKRVVEAIEEVLQKWADKKEVGRLREEIMGALKEVDGRLGIERAKVGRIGNAVDKVGKDIVKINSEMCSFIFRFD